MKIKILVQILFIMGIMLMLSNGCSKKADNSNPASTAGMITDIDGNGYDTIVIGTQVWMIGNLRTTKYNDGTPIPLFTDNDAWKNLTSPGYCWYQNSSTYKNPYGALYNWYAVNTGKLAPKGWHVPSDSEWTLLINYLGGDSIAGGKMKEKGINHWYSPNLSATNSSGFTAVPNGIRSYDGTFPNIFRGNASYWSSTGEIPNLAWYRNLFFNDPSVYRDAIDNTCGFAVRCIRD